MKKSVADAVERARDHSLKFPNTTVYVMDKPRQHAVVCACEWVYKERILAGWRTVATFRNGKKEA